MKMDGRYLVSLLVPLLMAEGYAQEAQERKDPRLRDEDISAAQLSVEISGRDDGLYEYVYTLNNPATNKGEIFTFAIDLVCNAAFEPISFPLETDDPGYLPAKRGTPPHTPTAIYAEWGQAATFSITIGGNALWGVTLEPGGTSTGLRLLSPAEPGLRNYTLKPYMDNGPDWAYPEEPDPTIPWIMDFAVTGLIPAPGCPGVTPPVDEPMFSGTRIGMEPNQINELLTYTNPLQDRMHLPEGTKHVEVEVIYSDKIDPDTFMVEPAWLRGYFHPVPGERETVHIPLRHPRNRIRLEVHPTKDVPAGEKRKDDDMHHSFKDADEFEFRVGTTKAAANASAKNR